MLELEWLGVKRCECSSVVLNLDLGARVNSAAGARQKHSMSLHLLNNRDSVTITPFAVKFCLSSRKSIGRDVSPRTGPTHSFQLASILEQASVFNKQLTSQERNCNNSLSSTDRARQLDFTDFFSSKKHSKYAEDLPWFDDGSVHGWNRCIERNPISFWRPSSSMLMTRTDSTHSRCLNPHGN